MTATTSQSMDDYLVTGERQISRLCRRIIASNKPISVNFNESKESFNSLLFDLNPDRNSCYIDALVPAHGTELLKAGKSASIHCNLDGIPTWFGAGAVIRQGSTDGQPWLELALPSRAWYRQRRNAFRAQTIAALNLAVELHSHHRPEPLMARLQDLSVTGCRAITSDQPEPPLEELEHFYRCQLFDGENPVISCSAEVRHLHPTTENDPSQLGLEFIDLTPQHDSVLSQLVMKIDASLQQPLLTA
jgi:c-di-GMP-binding flagellar brake protein YcgR